MDVHSSNIQLGLTIFTLFELNMMLEKNQIQTLKINKSGIVEGVCDTERREKMPS